jgi:hypothetical protein
MISAAATTSPPDSSHTLASALMKEIFRARNELQASLESSAVSRSISINSAPSPIIGA